MTARVAAIVLAAGTSRRMAPRNKLLLPDHTGKPMVARTVAAACGSEACEVIVVTGHQAADIRAALAGPKIRFVYAPEYADGLSASLRAGLVAADPGAQAAIICLGDMPDVTAELLDRLIEAYRRHAGQTIVVPSCQGRRGNPVLWDRRFFPDMQAIAGDRGARALLDRHAASVIEVQGDTSILTDYDTPASLGVGVTR